MLVFLKASSVFVEWFQRDTNRKLVLLEVASV